MLENVSLCENLSSLKKSKFEIKINENFWLLERRKILPKKMKKGQES